MALVDRSFTGNVALIAARKMQFEAGQYLLWGRWAKFNTPDGKAVNPNKGILPTMVNNSPVVIQRELQRKMGDEIDVPKMRLLINKYTGGLDQLKDREETQKVNHAKVYIDILRHAVEHQEGVMMTQTTKDYQLAQNAIPQLRQHYAEVSNYYQAANAFYKGYSDNVLSSVRFSLSAYSHPHVFTAGNGKASYSAGNPGTAGYETTLGTDITSIGSSDVFDTSLLQALSADETVRKIRPLMMKDGNPFRIIVAHPYQLYNLKTDSAFREVTSRADAQAFAKDNPLLVGCKYFWDGWAIFDGAQAVWPARVSSGSAAWGPSSTADLEQFRDYSSYNKFGAFVIGDNALFKAIGQTMRFIPRTDDYEELKAVAYRTVEGYSRGDFKNLDDGTAGAKWINEGSAICITYGAKPTL